MSRASFQGALAEVFALLASDANGTPEAPLVTAGVAKVYDAEPGAAGWVKPCSVTVAPSGITPTDWTVEVRVYVDDQYAARAQDLLVDATVAVDALLKTGEAFGPSQWDMGWQPPLECWLARCTLQVGREDGF